MAFQDLPLVVFWLVLAICFGLLSWETFKLRNKIVPKQFVTPGQYDDQFTGLRQAGNVVLPLASIFMRMLFVELVAFILSATAAVIEGVFLFLK